MLEDYIKKKQTSKPLLIMAHAVTGFPSIDDNLRMLEAMQEAGIDLVELQMPFSEPIADGPAFIRANQTALALGAHWDEYFNFFEKAAALFDFPLLFMGYYNSVFCMGHEEFCQRLQAAGGKGYIIADLPIELGSELDTIAQHHGLDAIHSLTPVTGPQRMQQIVSASSGFLYCVARKGVTGDRTAGGEELSGYLQRCRDVTNLPLAVGFGIKTPEQVRQLNGLANIAVVGTACLEAWEQQGESGFRDYLKGLVEAASIAD